MSVIGKACGKLGKLENQRTESAERVAEASVNTGSNPEWRKEAIIASTICQARPGCTGRTMESEDHLVSEDRTMESEDRSW